MKRRDRTTRNATSTNRQRKVGGLEAVFARRDVIKASLTGAAAIAAMKGLGPFVRNAEAATLEISWLGWEHYNVKSITSAFEKEHDCKVSAGFFDGNSEAYNKLKAGGTKDFDLVMADGFWPRLYGKQGMVQPTDYSQLSNLKYVFPDFQPGGYDLLREEDGENMVAAPNCWGGYGFTVNMDKIDEADADSVGLLYNEKYGKHFSTSARFEENIALTGILVAHQMGTMDKARPDGKPFNPYVLTDEELAACKDLLIKQKELLVTRWNDEDTLERLLRAQVVWASPEWSGIYRRIHFDKLDGKTELNMRHVLRPKEGGLGWVDTWGVTSGVTDSEKLELVHRWIDFRLKPENMAIVATEIGWAPCVDVREMIPERYVETLFLNETGAIKGLFQFDAPSSPEKWERIWSEVEAA
ncbi:MAG: PotD/PotF family extracellular solute-binding protein [Kiloniellales bacterium]|nr:PotD/PotF family extracellular solute-binding protein [Kiloniellales bacterium]